MASTSKNLKAGASKSTLPTLGLQEVLAAEVEVEAVSYGPDSVLPSV